MSSSLKNSGQVAGFSAIFLVAAALSASAQAGETAQSRNANNERLAQLQPSDGRGLGADRVLSLEDTPPTLEELADRMESSINGASRILGGTQARPGQWPSMVAIYYRDTKGRDRPFCGGTVIAKNWVLTAAHCAVLIQEEPKTLFFIREGTINLNADGKRDVRVSEAVVHDRYKPSPPVNDVALLRLNGTASAPPQPLIGGRQVDQTITPRRATTVIGFGLTTDGGKPSAQLLQVDVPVVSKAECQKAYNAQSITDATFCAGADKGGKDSCQGDSGGPSYMTSPGGQLAQVGVVSWGRGCGIAGAPGVYASVGRFEDWIRAKVRDVVIVGGRDDAAAAAPQVTNQAMQSISAGAVSTSQPSQLAQLSVEIVQGKKLKVGEVIDIRVLSSVDGRLALFNEDSDKRAYQIFPTPAMTSAQPGTLDRITAGKNIMLPPPRLKEQQGFQFRITPPAGKNRLVAVVVPAGAKVDDILARYADGSDFHDLASVISELADATRGIEVVQMPPVNRAVAKWDYEIVE